MLTEIGVMNRNMRALFPFVVTTAISVLVLHLPEFDLYKVLPL